MLQEASGDPPPSRGNESRRAAIADQHFSILSFRTHEIVLSSEHHFQSELDDARQTGRGHHSEVAIEIAAGRIKLCVIEGIEELASELHAGSFRDLRVLLDGNIPVVDSRSVEESPPRRPQLTKGFLAE